MTSSETDLCKLELDLVREQRVPELVDRDRLAAVGVDGAEDREDGLHGLDFLRLATSTASSRVTEEVRLLTLTQSLAGSKQNFLLRSTLGRERGVKIGPLL